MQPIHSPHSSIWSATSPQNTISTNTTPNRLQQSSSSNTSISVPRVEVTNSLQPPRNTILSPASFIPELRLASSHPGRTRATPVLNPNTPTLSRTNDHTYLFPLDHKTWNPPPPLYGPTNLGDTLTNWSRNRLTNTLNLTHRQRNSAPLIQDYRIHAVSIKLNNTNINNNIFTYMKIDTQIQSQYRIQNKLKEHIKDSINEKLKKHIKNIKNKNKIKIHTSNTIELENFNKLMKHVSDNQTELTADSNSIQDIYNIIELENFKNSSDYEEIWNIAIDKWTRNWNFYRERLTNSILEKFQLNNKRQKRQTKEDYIELTGQNINGSAIGPQDIFIEHYDCDAEEITNVKYYELNKISTCKFKPLDLDMTKTEVQLLSKAQAVEIKAYAVAGTIKERVEWCSQHTNYIRANRPSYYVSDAQTTKILDPDEVRNELARLNLLKNTEYKPRRYNISLNYIANLPLQKRIEDLQGRIQFHLDTPMVPPYGRIVYDYTNPTWIPSAIKNAQTV